MSAMSQRSVAKRQDPIHHLKRSQNKCHFAERLWSSSGFVKDLHPVSNDDAEYDAELFKDQKRACSRCQIH